MKSDFMQWKTATMSPICTQPYCISSARLTTLGNPGRKRWNSTMAADSRNLIAAKHRSCRRSPPLTHARSLPWVTYHDLNPHEHRQFIDNSPRIHGINPKRWRGNRNRHRLPQLCASCICSKCGRQDRAGTDWRGCGRGAAHAHGMSQIEGVEIQVCLRHLE